MGHKVIVVSVPDNIDLTWETERKDFTVRTPFECEVNVDGKEIRITVPKHFHTDLASIPRIFLSLTGGKMGRHIVAAVVHDYIYRITNVDITKDVADEIFYTIMEHHNVWWGRRQILYQAVRLAGDASYRKRT